MNLRSFRVTTLVFLFLLVSTVSVAQYGETIRSGRPGQAIGPFTVGARVLQIQAGTDFSAARYRTAETGAVNERRFGADMVTRIGLTERFEMSFGLAYLNDRMRSDSLNRLSNGISAFSVRIRSNVLVGKGLIPTVGFQFNLGLPAVSKDYRAAQVAPKLTVMTGQRLGKRFGFTTNSGVVWNGNSEIPRGFYIFNLGYDITDFMFIFIEQYADMGRNSWNGSVDGGFGFLVNPDLQLDVLGGYGPFNVHDDWFVSAGVSWRIRFNKREKTE